MNRKHALSKLHSRACLFVLYFVTAAASFQGYYDKWHFGEDGVSLLSFAKHLILVVLAVLIAPAFAHGLLAVIFREAELRIRTRRRRRDA